MLGQDASRAQSAIFRIADHMARRVFANAKERIVVEDTHDFVAIDLFEKTVRSRWRCRESVTLPIDLAREMVRALRDGMPERG